MTASKMNFRPWVTDLTFDDVWYKGEWRKNELQLYFYENVDTGFQWEYIQILRDGNYHKDLFARYSTSPEVVVSHMGVRVENNEQAMIDLGLEEIPVLQACNLGHHAYLYLDTEPFLGFVYKLIQRENMSVSFMEKIQNDYDARNGSSSGKSV